MGDITRDVLEGVGPNGVDVREYRHQRAKLPSVTTILKTRDEDKSNLYDWQDRNDGEGDNAYHQHLFWYSRHIGTLGHWHALSFLDPTLDWTEDESQSAAELFDMEERDVRGDSPREVLYSVLKDQNAVQTWGDFYDEYPPYEGHEYYKTKLVEQADRDVSFFRQGQMRLWKKLGIDQDNVIAVEKYLFDTEYEYAGQVDLVYEDDDGDVVVADLKSSSGCYEKHKLQGAAYGSAVERDAELDVDSVDRIEVHRVNPSSGQMAVHSHEQATPVHTTEYWSEDFDELWEGFRQLAEAFEYRRERPEEDREETKGALGGHGNSGT